MQYYQCDKYPIEFVLSENIDKHFDSHNHVRYYIIRKFKNCIGMTPHQFCIQNRIRKSQNLLDAERTISFALI